MGTLEMAVSSVTKEILPMSIRIFQFSRNYNSFLCCIRGNHNVFLE